jgi:hypothetical protein
MTADLAEALAPVADALDALGVAYRVGGSVASSALGVGRSTFDIDLVADLAGRHVDALVRAARRGPTSTVTRSATRSDGARPST